MGPAPQYLRGCPGRVLRVGKPWLVSAELMDWPFPAPEVVRSAFAFMHSDTRSIGLLVR